MWAPSFSTVRIIQRCIFQLACGSACGSIILFVAGFTTGSSPTGAIHFPRIFTTVGVAVFAYHKSSMSHDGRRLMVLCLSCFCAILFVFYAGRIISVAQTEHTFVLYLAGGIDVAIAILLLIDGVLADLYSIHLNSIQATSSRNISAESSGNIHDALQEPLPVHVYQPRLSLAASEETSSQSTTTVPTSDDNEVVTQDNEAVELEELPKYERRRPTQHATIVDMANLESVDATILRSAVSVSSLELDVTNNDDSGYEQGEELRWELGGRLSTAAAPEYSPSLEEAPAETLSLLPSPAPTYDRIAPLASSRHSGSVVILTMPLSETPAGPTTVAPPGGAPLITVTSAPPVYTP